MSRRHIAAIALALATFAISACSNITGPQSNDGTSKTSTTTASPTCQVTNGNGTC